MSEGAVAETQAVLPHDARKGEARCVFVESDAGGGGEAGGGCVSVAD